MADNKIKIEIFSAPACKKCIKAFRRVEAVLAELENDAIELRKVDIVEELDYAIKLGLRATPAITINGKLVFTATPTHSDLRVAIQSQLSS